MENILGKAVTNASWTADVPDNCGQGVVCITSPSGVYSFSPKSYTWTNNPLLLGAAASVAISSNRNLVVQTEDSIQIFSIDVLTSQEVENDVLPSHVYSLGKNYILRVLQPNRHLTLFESKTLEELRPDDETLPFRALLYDRLPSAPALFFPGWLPNSTSLRQSECGCWAIHFPNRSRWLTRIRRGHCMDCHWRAP